MLRGISVFYNNQKESASGIAEIFRERAAAAEVRVSEDRVTPETGLVVSIGGDGTVLRAARAALEPGVPVAHINTGTLGFMGEEPGDIRRYADMLLRGEYKLEERMMLEAASGDFACFALNDVVIKNGATARVINLQISINGLEVHRIKGDGVIISTPTGSTAYSLAAGGPVAEPELDVIIVTPLNPHSLNSRSIVISPGSVLEISALIQGQEVILTADGQISRNLAPPVSASVRASSTKLKLVISSRNFFGLLSQKMNWGI